MGGCHHPWAALAVEFLVLVFVQFSTTITDMAVHFDSVASDVTHLVTNAQNRFFEIDDFPEASRGAVARTLSRLAGSGELKRVRRGTYWRGVQTPLGMVPPSPMAILKHTYGSSASLGPARLDAAGMLGLTTQVAARPTFAVPYLVEGLDFNLIKRDRRRGRQTQNLRPLEIALYEVLGDWDELVEIAPREAVRRISSLLRGGDLRAQELARGVNSEPPLVRERLRGILRATQETQAEREIRPAASETVRQSSAKTFGELLRA